MLLFYGIVFLVPKSVTFSYSGETCASRLTLLPDLHQTTKDSPYSVEYQQKTTLGSVALWSTKACLQPVASPSEGETVVRSAPWGGVLFTSLFRVKTASPPTLDTAMFKVPVSAAKPLSLKLSALDHVHRYSVAVNGSEVECKAGATSVECDMGSLGLKQGETYQAAVTRQFEATAKQPLYEGDVTVVTPLSIVESSFPSGVVYEKPTELLLRTDKPLEQHAFRLVKKEETGQRELPITVERVEPSLLRVRFGEELPRESSYELRADEFTATDGSTTLEPYVFSFTTSGGPRVTGVNVGTSGVAVGAQVVVTFDQPLKETQDIGKFLRLGSGVSLAAVRGNQLVFSTAGVGVCGDIALSIMKGLESTHGVVGTTDWAYKGVTNCYTVGSIGTSVRGRAIPVYYFGSGPRTIVYTGAIHGNEASTKYFMDAWIAELNANARAIPAGTTVVVVPAINPDGFASGARVNARNVDLNRNFATSDWQKDVSTVNNRPFPGGGGESPLSEPEARALASFVGRLRPELVLSYHSIGGLAQGNECGISAQRTATYSSLSGYRNTTGQGGVFEYAISGTADVYYCEKLGVASITIELGSHTNAQFSRNKAAMWAMIK